MAQKVPLSQRFKDRAVRQVIEQAALEDWDYSKFWTKASALGMNDQPQIQNYAVILKEKRDYQRKEDIKTQEKARGSEVAGLMAQATYDREQTPTIPGGGAGQAPAPASALGQPALAQPPLEGAEHYTGMKSNPWGDTPHPQAQSQGQSIEQKMTIKQPIAGPPPAQEDLTQRQVYETIGALAKKKGIDPATEAEAKKYGLGLYVDIKDDDPLGWAKIELRNRAENRRKAETPLKWFKANLQAEGLEVRQSKAVYDEWSTKNKLATSHEFDFDKVTGQMEVLQGEVKSMEMQIEDPALDPEDVADLQKELDKKKLKLQGKEKEQSSTYKQMIKAGSDASDAQSMFFNTLKKEKGKSILSEYKKAQKSTLSPSGGTVPVPTVPVKTPDKYYTPNKTETKPPAPRGDTSGETTVIMTDKAGNKALVLVDKDGNKIRVIKEL